MTPILRYTPLVAALQFAGVALAGSVSYYDSAESITPRLTFETACGQTDLRLLGSQLRCSGGSLPPAPSCDSFGVINTSTSAPGTAATASVEARKGDVLVFTGACTKAQASTSNAPLRYLLYKDQNAQPFATNEGGGQFSVRVPTDATTGSLASFYLKAEQAGATSAATSAAAYTVVDNVIAAPNGCAVSPVAPFWYSGSTASTFSVSCTTGTLTGNANYGWFLNGTSTGTTGSSYTPSNSLAVGDYTVSVRVCNDPTQQAAGGASCVTPSTTAQVRVVSNATPPTGCSISANVTLPATVNSGTSLTFSPANCQNTSTGTTYTWKRNGNTLSSNVVTFTNTSGVSITEGITLEACNPAVGSGSPACQTPTPSTSVTVLPAAVQQGQNCTNYAGITTTQTATRNLSDGWIIYDLSQSGNGYPPQPMTGSQAWVVAFTTPNFTGNFQGAISGGADAQGGASKTVVLGTAACAEWNGSTKLAYQIGSTFQFDYYMGSGGRGPQLQPNTTYYLTITNRYWFGTGLANSCNVTQEGGCPTKLQITGPL